MNAVCLGKCQVSPAAHDVTIDSSPVTQNVHDVTGRQNALPHRRFACTVSRNKYCTIKELEISSTTIKGLATSRPCDQWTGNIQHCTSSLVSINLTSSFVVLARMISQYRVKHEDRVYDALVLKHKNYPVSINMFCQ